MKIPSPPASSAGLNRWVGRGGTQTPEPYTPGHRRHRVFFTPAKLKNQTDTNRRGQIDHTSGNKSSKPTPNLPPKLGTQVRPAQK